MNVCRALRRAGNPVPILMLTAYDAITSRVAGLDAGADDYLVKPFVPEELAARLRALLRRPRDGQPGVLQVADLSLDTAAREGRRGGRRIILTAREYAVLELLMRKAGTVLDRAEISRHVWDDNYDPASNIIDVYVNRLRVKIDHDFDLKLIHTLRGQLCVPLAPGRGSAPRRSGAPGSGLGLAVAQWMVQSRGGSISVERVRPHGARFVVRLPASPLIEDSSWRDNFSAS